MYNPSSFNNTAASIKIQAGVICAYRDSVKAAEVIATGSYYSAGALMAFEFIGSQSELDKTLEDMLALDCEFILRWNTGTAPLKGSLGSTNSITKETLYNCLSAQTANPAQSSTACPANPLFALASLWSV